MPVFPGLVFQLIRLKPDIIHAYGPCVNDDIAALVALLTKKPCVLTYFADFGPRSKGNILVSLYLFLKPFFTLKIPKEIVVISKIYIHLLVSRRVSEQKIKLLPPPVDTHVFRSLNKMATKKKLGLSDKRVVLFVGSLGAEHAYKRLDLLLDAFKQVSRNVENVKLVVVGEGSLKSHYRQMCRRLGLERQVLFKGFVPDKQLPEYYAAADVFVLPSPTSSEGFGIVLLEAMSSGCPVIVASGCGGSFIVEKNLAGIVVPSWSVEGLEYAMTKILSDKKLAHMFGLNGRRIAEKHSVEIISSQLERIYQGLIRGK
jgi:glycosyltransferase involved in cell wall biosynthesis